MHLAKFRCVIECDFYSFHKVYLKKKDVKDDNYKLFVGLKVLKYIKLKILYVNFFLTFVKTISCI